MIPTPGHIDRGSCLWCASAPCWVVLLMLANLLAPTTWKLMALIDQQYLKTPFYGSRRMTLAQKSRTPGQQTAG